MVVEVVGEPCGGGAVVGDGWQLGVLLRVGGEEFEVVGVTGEGDVEAGLVGDAGGGESDGRCSGGTGRGQRRGSSFWHQHQRRIGFGASSSLRGAIVVDTVVAL